MVVYGLKEYLEKNQLIKTSPLSELKGKKLGIDGFHWLRTHVQDKVTDIYQVALGGAPFSFSDKDDPHFLAFSNKKHRENEITPIFVFNGLSSPVQKEKLPNFNAIESSRNQLWKPYFSGKGFENLQNQVFSVNLPLISFEHVFTNILDKSSPQIEFFRAPMFCWAQLAYFNKKPNNYSVYAAEEALMYQINQLIMNIDLEKKTYSYVDRNEMLKTMDLNSTQFVELCLMMGSFYSQGYTFQYRPKIEDVMQGAKNGPRVQPFDDPTDTEMFLKFKSEKSLEDFMKLKSLVINHPYFDTDSKIRIMDQKTVPESINDILGMKFPDSVYFLMVNGIVSHKVFHAICGGKYPESAPPLVDTEERNKILFPELQKMRAKIISLLRKHLNKEFSTKEIIFQTINAKQPNHPGDSITAAINEHKLQNLHILQGMTSVLLGYHEKQTIHESKKAEIFSHLFSHPATSALEDASLKLIHDYIFNNFASKTPKTEQKDELVGSFLTSNEWENAFKRFKEARSGPLVFYKESHTIQEILNFFLNDKAFITLFLEKTEEEKKKMQQKEGEDQNKDEKLNAKPSIPHLKKKEKAHFFILLKFLEMLEFFNPEAAQSIPTTTASAPTPQSTPSPSKKSAKKEKTHEKEQNHFYFQEILPEEKPEPYGEKHISLFNENPLSDIVSIWGKMLYLAPPQFQEAAIMWNQLFRWKLINGKPLTPVMIDQSDKAIPDLDPKEEKAINRLISRVFSLVKFNPHKSKDRQSKTSHSPSSVSTPEVTPKPAEEPVPVPENVTKKEVPQPVTIWNGEVSYDLAMFVSLVRGVFETNRRMLDSVLTSLFLSKVLVINPAELYALSYALPFSQCEPNNALGVIISSLLDAFDKKEPVLFGTPSESTVSASSPRKGDHGCKPAISAYLLSKFPLLENGYSDLKRALEFWDKTYQMVRCFKDFGMKLTDPKDLEYFESVIKLYEQANKKLQELNVLLWPQQDVKQRQ